MATEERLVDGRILEVIALRKQGLRIAAISRRLGTSQRNIQLLEEAVVNGIRSAVEQNTLSYGKIAGRADVSISALPTIAEFYGIILPPRFHSTRQIDATQVLEKVDDGLPLENFGALFDVSRQCMQQYLSDAGLLERWKRSRKGVRRKPRVVDGETPAERAQQEEDVRERIAALKWQMGVRAKEQGWAYEQAVAPILSRTVPVRASETPLEQVIELFKRAQYAAETGIALTNKDYAAGLDIHPASAARLLRRAGERPAPRYAHHEWHSPWKKNAMSRGFEIGLSHADVSHFLRIPEYVTNYHLRQWNASNAPVMTAMQEQVMRIRPVLNRRGLSFGMVSEIYEAKAAGFSRTEICLLVGTGSKTIGFALQRRKEIQPLLVSALQFLCLDPSLQAPYISPHQVEGYVTRSQETRHLAGRYPA